MHTYTYSIVDVENFIISSRVAIQTLRQCLPMIIVVFRDRFALTSSKANDLLFRVENVRRERINVTKTPQMKHGRNWTTTALQRYSPFHLYNFIYVHRYFRANLWASLHIMLIKTFFSSILPQIDHLESDFGVKSFEYFRPRLERWLNVSSTIRWFKLLKIAYANETSRISKNIT